MSKATLTAKPAENQERRTILNQLRRKPYAKARRPSARVVQGEGSNPEGIARVRQNARNLTKPNHKAGARVSSMCWRLKARDLSSVVQRVRYANHEPRGGAKGKRIRWKRSLEPGAPGALPTIRHMSR